MGGRQQCGLLRLLGACKMLHQAQLPGVSLVAPCCLAHDNHVQSMSAVIVRGKTMDKVRVLGLKVQATHQSLISDVLLAVRVLARESPPA